MIDSYTVYREFRKILDEYSAATPRMSVGEIHIYNFSELVKYYGMPEIGLEFHMPFNFSLLKPEWNAQSFRKLVDEYEATLPAWAWPNYVLSNHDEGRIASRYGKEQARVAAMMVLTLRGTPTVYYGEEIGMTDVKIPQSQQLDPFGLQVPGLGRDRCRTPMQWDASPNAGFSHSGASKLWLPVSDQYPTINVARELDDPMSTLNLYRNLLTIRKSNPALQWGSYTPLDDVPAGCFVYLREAKGQRYLTALNFSSESHVLHLSDFVDAKIVLSTYLDRDETINLKKFVLRENEGILIQLGN